MRLLVPVCLFLSLGLLSAEEDPIQLLKASQEDRTKLVPAIRALTQAINRAETANDEAKSAELNACLFWARKRLNIQEVDALVQAAPEVARAADEVVGKEVDTAQAQIWLTRASAYANGQSDPLLKAIRYYEVAHRFQGTAEGLNAMEKSLALMQEATIPAGPRQPFLVPTDQWPGKPKFEVEVTTSEKLGEGWSVFVDGMPMTDSAGFPALTPCTIRLPEGNHQVAVAKEGFVDPYAGRIRVRSDTENTVEIKGLVAARPGGSRLMMLAYGKFLGRWVEQGKPPQQARIFTVELLKGVLSMKDAAAGGHSLESVRLSESTALFRWSGLEGTEAFKIELKSDGKTALFSHYSGSPEIRPGMTRLPARPSSVARFVRE